MQTDIIWFGQPCGVSLSGAVEFVMNSLRNLQHRSASNEINPQHSHLLTKSLPHWLRSVSSAVVLMLLIRRTNKAACTSLGNFSTSNLPKRLSVQSGFFFNGTKQAAVLKLCIPHPQKERSLSVFVLLSEKRVEWQGIQTETKQKYLNK